MPNGPDKVSPYWPTQIHLYWSVVGWFGSVNLGTVECGLIWFGSLSTQWGWFGLKNHSKLTQTDLYTPPPSSSSVYNVIIAIAIGTATSPLLWSPPSWPQPPLWHPTLSSPPLWPCCFLHLVVGFCNSARSYLACGSSPISWSKEITGTHGSSASLVGEKIDFPLKSFKPSKEITHLKFPCYE